MEYIDKNQLFLQDLVARMPHHVYWMNKDNIYLGCNDVQAKRFGLNSPKEIVGRSIYELFPQGRTDALAKNNKQVIKLGIPKTFEESYVTPDGNVINYLSFNSPLNHNVKIIVIIGFSIYFRRKKHLSYDLK